MGEEHQKEDKQAKEDKAAEPEMFRLPAGMENMEDYLYAYLDTSKYVGGRIQKAQKDSNIALLSRIFDQVHSHVTFPDQKEAGETFLKAAIANLPVEASLEATRKHAEEEKKHDANYQVNSPIATYMESYYCDVFRYLPQPVLKLALQRANILYNAMFSIPDGRMKERFRGWFHSKFPNSPQNEIDNMIAYACLACVAQGLATAIKSQDQVEDGWRTAVIITPLNQVIVAAAVKSHNYSDFLEKRKAELEQPIVAKTHQLYARLAELNRSSQDKYTTMCVAILEAQNKKLIEILRGIQATTNLLYLASVEQSQLSDRIYSSSEAIYNAWKNSQKSYGVYVAGASVAVAGGGTLAAAATGFTVAGAALSSTGIGLPLGIVFFVAALILFALNYSSNQNIENHRPDLHKQIEAVYQETAVDARAADVGKLIETLPSIPSATVVSDLKEQQQHKVVYSDDVEVSYNPGDLAKAAQSINMASEDQEPLLVSKQQR